MPYVAVFMPGAEPQRFELRDTNVFGRSSANEVYVPDPNVSRQHCALERVDGQWVLSDLGSTNGTWLDAARVRRHPLRDGETFYIGDARVVFHADRWVEHRPADPHESMSLSQIMAKGRGLADAHVDGARPATRRALPAPRATVAARGQYRQASGSRSLAFRRAPAMPIVHDSRTGSWLRVILKAMGG